MSAPYYVLNLSRHTGLKLVPEPLPGHKPVSPRVPGDLIGGIPNDDHLILYVVGHALPDTFFNDNTPIEDDVLKDQIREARSGKKTLIIWDVCFSMSALTPGPSPVDGHDPHLDRKSKHFWGKETVHLFSSQSYEPTWHLGDKQGRVTLFSQQLKEALQTLNKAGKWDWERLEAQLRQQFGSLQRPQIVHAAEGPKASDFFG